MKSKTKEWIYYGIIALCLLMCAVLLLSVALGRPILFSSRPEAHRPPEPITGGKQMEEQGAAPEQARADGLTLREEDFAAMLDQYLPQGFPLKNSKVEIYQTGKVELSTTLGRAELEDYLEESGVKMGIKEGVLLRLLPKQLDFACSLQGSQDEESGLVLLTPKTLSLNGAEVELSLVPQGIFDGITNGVNAMLAGTGTYFKTVEFIDGAVVLKS